MATNKSTRNVSQHDNYTELPGMRARNFAPMADFIGINFVVMDVKVKPSPFTAGDTITEVSVQPVGETAITTFTASKYAANQFANLDASEYIGRNMTVIEAPELASTSRSSKTPLVVDYWEHYWERANGNRAQQNRDLVARGKSKAQVIDAFDDSDDSDDSDDFDDSDDSDDSEPQTMTESQFHALDATTKKLIAKAIVAGDVKIVADKLPIKKSVAKVEVPSTKNAKKVVPVASKTSIGSVILVKGSEPRGRGRPPTIVTELLNAGRNVYYKNGTWFDDSKKVIYRAKN